MGLISLQCSFCFFEAIQRDSFEGYRDSPGGHWKCVSSLALVVARHVVD